MHSARGKLTELSVIIPSKDREEILYRHVLSLQRAIEGRNVEIIIVNDGKKPISCFGSNPEIRLFQNPKLGVASARNFGARQAIAPILLFLDDDMVVFKENIAAIIAFHQNHDNSFLNINWVFPPETNKSLTQSTFGRYLQAFDFNTLKGWNKGNEQWNDHILFETKGVTSQNLSTRSETFKKVGGYNESFPYAGFEDHEFSTRIIEQGFRIYIDPMQMCWHDESDRLTLKKWLMRKYQGGITRRVAVQHGFEEFKLTAGIWKLVLVRLNVVMETIFQFLLSKFRLKQVDHVCFKVINILLASAIYRGYFSAEAKSISSKKWVGKSG
jgi:GT2 family glycosyltransferase